MSGDENLKGVLHKICSILICDSNGMNAMMIKTQNLIDLPTHSKNDQYFIRFDVAI
jgi:hypothetical protein